LPLFKYARENKSTRFLSKSVQILDILQCSLSLGSDEMFAG
jgi:hypothetical protein